MGPVRLGGAVFVIGATVLVMAVLTGGGLSIGWLRRWSVGTPQWVALALLPLSWMLSQMLLPVWPRLAGSEALEAAGQAWCHGMLAALLAWRCGLPPWWVLIDAVFPLALQQALAQSWPSHWFLPPLLLLGALYWSNCLTRVPYFPSRPAVWGLVGQLLLPAPGQRVLDLGSGLGGLALSLATRRPDCQVTGIEVAPLPWLVSWARARWRRRGCRFLRGDYRRHDLSGYDLVFAYLSPAAMPALWEQLRRELKPGACFVSCEFGVSGQSLTCWPDSGVRGVPPLYVWRMGGDRVLRPERVPAPGLNNNFAEVMSCL